MAWRRADGKGPDKEIGVARVMRLLSRSVSIGREGWECRRGVVDLSREVEWKERILESGRLALRGYHVNTSLKGLAEG